MMRHFSRYLFIFLMVFSVQTLSGQVFHRLDDQERLVILSPGVSYQGQWFGELNLMLGSLEEGGPCSPPAYYGPRLGAEFNFDKVHFVYAPKIGYEVSCAFLCLRANSLVYVDDDKLDVRLLPEIGLSFFGMVNFTYGYNIPLSNFQTDFTKRNRFTMTVNLDFDLWGSLF